MTNAVWQYRGEIVEPGRTEKFVLSNDEGPLPWRQVVELLCTSIAFRMFLNGILADVVTFSAFRWETPPVTVNLLDRNFEFVVLNCPELSRTADPHAFAEHFLDNEVAVFRNLSGDATMIVPAPQKDTSAYCHLASFVRSAPEAQIDRVWEAVGTTMKRRVSDKPVWLSTAGMGVAWLHIRLDSRPKYYGYTPYKGG